MVERISQAPATGGGQTIQKLLYLRTLPLVGDLEPGHLAALAAAFEERSFREGETLLREGEPVDTFHIVVEGRVRLHRRGEIVATVGPRERVAFYHLLAQRERGIGATAASRVRTLALDSDALMEVLEDDFRILHHALRRTAQLLIERRRSIPDHAGYVTQPAVPAWPTREHLDLVQRILVLRGTMPFRRVRIRSLAELAKRMEEVRIARGELLWRAGDPGASTLLPLSGEVDARVPETRQRFRLGPGDSAGALEPIASAPRWYEARVVKDLVALRFDGEMLVDVLEDDFDMAMMFLAALASDLLDLDVGGVHVDV